MSLRLLPFLSPRVSLSSSAMSSVLHTQVSPRLIDFRVHFATPTKMNTLRARESRRCHGFRLDAMMHYLYMQLVRVLG